MGGDLAEQLVALNFRPEVVIISRPHNYEGHAALIRREFPSARIVYDAVSALPPEDRTPGRPRP